MIYIVNYAIFACMFLMPSVTLAAQKNDEEQLQSWLKQIISFDAKFTQSTYDQHQGLISKGSGSFQYKRPNLVRWITHHPVEQHIIINGKNIWVYDPDLEQVLVDNYSSASLSASPLFKLLDTGDDLVTLYSIQRSVDENKKTTFKLTAKLQNEPIKAIEISFLAGILKSLSLHTHDQVSHFFFLNQSVNSMIDTSNFSFKIPLNTDVIDRSIFRDREGAGW